LLPRAPGAILTTPDRIARRENPTMMRFVLLAALLGLALLPAPPSAADDKPKDDEFVPVFNGKDLTGWKVSAKTGHSRTSKNTSGGKWVVEDGVMVGSQDVPGNGGIIITEKEYGDFEVALEMKNDFGPDSGLFLRSTDTGKCYQAMIDYHADGNLMGIYGEGLPGGKPHVRNFDFGKEVTQIIVPSKKSDDGGFKCPVTPEEWPKFWKHGEWNELRARIEGNPPKLTTWIKGVKFMEYQDTQKRLSDKGGIALQVHGGGDFTKQFVRYRNIRVRELK
jgi:hypothetical protein